MVKQAKVDGWMNFLTKLGTSQDPSTNTIYTIAVQLMEQQLRALYSGDGMVSNLVDIPAEDMTRKGFRVKGDVEDGVNSYYEEHGFYDAEEDGIRWNRLFGGAVILLGVDDGIGQLWRPVRENSIRKVEPVDVYDRFSVTPGDLYADPTKRSFGTPEKYIIQTESGGRLTVHETRLCLFKGLPVPRRTRRQNKGWGDSAVQRTYEQTKNLAEAAGHSNSIIQNFIQEVFSIEGLMELLQTDEGIKQLRERMEIMQVSRSTLNATFIDAKGETYSKVASSVTGLNDLNQFFMSLFASVARMPQALLFGRSPAGQNATGDSDWQNYYNHIHHLQKSVLRPIDERLVRYIMLAKDGPFKGQPLKDWKIEYLPLKELTEAEAADIKDVEAKTVDRLVRAGVLHHKVAAKVMFGSDRYSTDFKMEPKEIEELKEPKIGSDPTDTTEPDDTKKTKNKPDKTAAK